MKNTGEVWFIFLGSFLTFIASIIVEAFKQNKEKSGKAKNFKLIIKQELKVTTKTLEKLKTIFEYKTYFDYAVITALNKSIQNLESSSKDAIYLSSVDLQEKFIDLISDLSNFSTDIKGIQDLYYDQERKLDQDELNKKAIKQKTMKKESIFTDHKENAEAYMRKTTQKFIDLVEINRRLDEFIKLLR